MNTQSQFLQVVLQGDILMEGWKQDTWYGTGRL